MAADPCSAHASAGAGSPTRSRPTAASTSPQRQGHRRAHRGIRRDGRRRRRRADRGPRVLDAVVRRHGGAHQRLVRPVVRDCRPAPARTRRHPPATPPAWCPLTLLRTSRHRASSEPPEPARLTPARPTPAGHRGHGRAPRVRATPSPPASGPVALDAERASGYRYSQRAYLVQVRREGAGTALIDPIAFGDLVPLDAAIGDTEWILHAATQDLACLAEVGLAPAPAVRHRARRPAAQPAAGGPGLAGRALPRPQPGQGALRRRLVDPAAARAVARLRRARRRGAHRAPRPASTPSWRRPASASGRRRSSRPCSRSPARPRARSRGAVRRASTRPAAGARSAWSARSGRPATRSPRSAT